MKELILANTKAKAPSHVLKQKLTRYLNRFDLRLLDLLLWHGDGQHAILHGSLDLLHLGILWEPEPPQELPAAALNTVPRVILLLVFSGALTAYLKDVALFHLDLDLLFLDSWKIGLEHMGFRGFFPVDASRGKGGGVRREGEGGGGAGEGETFEWVPQVEREGVEEVVPPGDRHCYDCCLIKRQERSNKTIVKSSFLSSVLNWISLSVFLLKQTEGTAGDFIETEEKKGWVEDGPGAF
jgi:hypothetical protein